MTLYPRQLAVPCGDTTPARSTVPRIAAAMVAQDSAAIAEVCGLTRIDATVALIAAAADDLSAIHPVLAAEILRDIAAMSGRPTPGGQAELAETVMHLHNAAHHAGSGL